MAPAMARPKTKYQGFWSFAFKTAKNARVTKNARGISTIARRAASTNIPGKSRTKAEAEGDPAIFIEQQAQPVSHENDSGCK